LPFGDAVLACGSAGGGQPRGDLVPGELQALARNRHDLAAGARAQHLERILHLCVGELHQAPLHVDAAVAEAVCQCLHGLQALARDVQIEGAVEHAQEARDLWRLTTGSPASLMASEHPTQKNRIWCAKLWPGSRHECLRPLQPPTGRPELDMEPFPPFRGHELEPVDCRLNEQHSVSS
jgi:hypothetical protein